MITSEQIKALRKSRGWTQKEMAEYFGVNLSTIWRWEKQSPPTDGIALAVLKREIALDSTTTEILEDAADVLKEMKQRLGLSQ